MKKGLEIPVNMLVILAISVIVLLSVVVFFVGGFTPGAKSLENQQAFNNCASAWVRVDCRDYGNDPQQHFTCADGRAIGEVAADAGFRTSGDAKKAAGCDEQTSTGSSSGGSSSSGQGIGGFGSASE